MKAQCVFHIVFMIFFIVFFSPMELKFLRHIEVYVEIDNFINSQLLK